MLSAVLLAAGVTLAAASGAPMTQVQAQTQPSGKTLSPGKVKPAAVTPAPARPSAVSPSVGAGGEELPVEVSADNGIEWRQDEQVFLATGNAVAIRGEVRVESDVLRAHYREQKEGGTKVWRLDAEGHVSVTSPGQKAEGALGVYDVDSAVFVLSGSDVRYTSSDTIIRADKQLEFWQGRQFAVARGNARTVRNDQTLSADVMTAHFRTVSGKTEVYRVEAFDNVRIVTPTETVSSERAVYDVPSGVAVLTGGVKLTRGKTQLNGCRAEVNVNAGSSRLLACEGGGATGRVKGLLTPEDTRNGGAK